MKVSVYSFFDSAASAFMKPFYVHGDGEAVRIFQSAINADDKNNMSLYPQQFTLFKLGEFDDKNASFKLLDAPLSIALGVELVEKPKTLEEGAEKTDYRYMKELLEGALKDLQDMQHELKTLKGETV